MNSRAARSRPDHGFAESAIRLNRGGWLRGVIVDFDRENFYVAWVSNSRGAEDLISSDPDGVTSVPHSLIAEVKTDA